MGVVITDRQGQWGQQTEILEQLISHLAVALGGLPIELADQMVMGDGRGDTDIMQHPQLEQQTAFGLTHPQLPAALGSHNPDPFTVGHIANAHQIQRG